MMRQQPVRRVPLLTWFQVLQTALKLSYLRTSCYWKTAGAGCVSNHEIWKLIEYLGIQIHDCERKRMSSEFRKFEQGVECLLHMRGMRCQSIFRLEGFSWLITWCKLRLAYSPDLRRHLGVQRCVWIEISSDVDVANRDVCMARAFLFWGVACWVHLGKGSPGKWRALEACQDKVLLIYRDIRRLLQNTGCQNQVGSSMESNQKLHPHWLSLILPHGLQNFSSFDWYTGSGFCVENRNACTWVNLDLHWSGDCEIWVMKSRHRIWTAHLKIRFENG